MSEVMENSQKSHWHEALDPIGLGLTVPSVQMRTGETDRG